MEALAMSFPACAQRFHCRWMLYDSVIATISMESVALLTHASSALILWCCHVEEIRPEGCMMHCASDL